jgi:hypothetical protein
MSWKPTRGTRVFVGKHGLILSFPGNVEEQKELEKKYKEIQYVRDAKINFPLDDIITVVIEAPLDIINQKEGDGDENV